VKLSRENVTLLSLVGGAIGGISAARSLASAFLPQAGICVAVAIVVTLALRAALRWQLDRDERPR
jgi:hypothetical protein